MLSSSHALARRHHLLEGHVFNQLATAFKEEGKKCGQVNVVSLISRLAASTSSFIPHAIIKWRQ